MKLRDPIARLPTHDVVNMPPHLGDQDLWACDEPLRAWTAAMGGGGHADHLARVGRLAGRDETFEKANQANRYPPELRTFDRHGMRVDAVEYHPAYHDLMALVLQGALLTGHGAPAVAEAFCASRLAPRYRGAFGTLPKGCDLDGVIARAGAG